MSRKLFAIMLVSACAEAPDVDELDDVDQELLTGGGTLNIALVPYYYTDSDPAERMSHAELRDLMFTGAGTDGATGSVKGFWTAISNGRIAVRGFAYRPLPVIATTATSYHQRGHWRPQDDWYIPPDHQVAGFNCRNETWGLTPEKSNFTTLLRDDPAFPGLYLCRDPEGDANHFWSRDGNGPYNAMSVCPLGGVAQRPQVGKYYCIHRNVMTRDQVNHTWALAAAAGQPLDAYDHNGNLVAAVYSPADWQDPNEVTLYGYPSPIPGTAPSSQYSFMPLARSDRPYSLYNAVHEPGHNVGLWHAPAASCTSASGQTVTFDHGVDRCVMSMEYGPANFMGRSQLAWGDGYELLAVGAIAPANLTTVTASGTFSLSPLATSPQVLRVATGVDLSALPRYGHTGPSYFYLDNRQAIANTFDQGIGAFAGVELHVAPDYAAEQARCGMSSSCTYGFLLDGHAETPGNFDDATLKSGDSFTHAAAGLTMQVTGATPSASVDISFVPPSTKVLFVPRTGGSGWADRESAGGTLTNVHTIAGFSSWALIAGAHDNGLLFYNAGVIYTAHVDADGRYRATGGVTGTAANVAGWTQIVAVGRGRLLFYNAATGAYVVAHITPSGGFTVKSTGTRPGYTTVAGTLNGGVLWYAASTGDVRSESLDGNGVFTNARQATIASGFTSITPVRQDGLVFYNAATGAVRTARLDDARILTLMDSDTWSTEWTQVIGGANGNLLLYRASDGFLWAVNVDASYNTVWIGPKVSHGANHILTSIGGEG